MTINNRDVKENTCVEAITSIIPNPHDGTEGLAQRAQLFFGEVMNALA